MESFEDRRKLQNLMNNVQLALMGGQDIFDEDYFEDVKKRAAKAEKALKELQNFIEKGEK
ncbi:hypothetical protein [Planococcus beigongshangi]|uniref:hypothetical protein n=1 Tax=Planococcus beigongshangi TaxID=2782536 RepID=UPI00193B087B|nr:hypothetical protein [Planococcus beigongshangi]